MEIPVQLFVVLLGRTPRPAMSPGLESPQRTPVVAAGKVKASDANESGSAIGLVSYNEEILSASAATIADAGDPFAGQAELSLTHLVAAVQQRNPSLLASLATWAAAAERYPQVVALEDPVFQSMFAPGSFSSSSSVQASYFVGIAQKIPWAGKRALRGQIAQAQANDFRCRRSRNRH